MTTPIKTQCPHCHASFNLPHAQLNKADAKARCARCQQVFLVNEHLIVSANNQQALIDKAIPKDKTDTDKQFPIDTQADDTKETTAKETVPENNVTKPTELHSSTELETQTEADIDDNVLIYDDMEIDDAPEPITEYGSLDEMDAWLTQLDDSNSNKADTTEPTSIDNNNNRHHSDVSLAQSKTTTPTTHQSSTHSNSKASANSNPSPSSPAVISSTAANDIYSSVTASGSDHISENAWLETLLQEQNESGSNTENEPDDTDLSQLLTNIGMVSEDEEKLSKERNHKIQARMQESSTRPQNSIATALWTAGCLVLMLLLFAQYVIFNLNTLMKDPDYAARLQTVCTMAACSLPHADITTLNITDLMHKPSQVNSAAAFSDIQATLVNQSSNAQLLPNLKVSIQGNKALIGEFIALPQDYLLSTQSLLAANRGKPVMFTVPLPANQISQITIVPIY